MIEYQENGSILLTSDIDPARTSLIRKGTKEADCSALIGAFFAQDCIEPAQSSNPVLDKLAEVTGFSVEQIKAALSE